MGDVEAYISSYDIKKASGVHLKMYTRNYRKCNGVDPSENHHSTMLFEMIPH